MKEHKKSEILPFTVSVRVPSMILENMITFLNCYNSVSMISRTLKIGRLAGKTVY